MWEPLMFELLADAFGSRCFEKNQDFIKWRARSTCLQLHQQAWFKVNVMFTVSVQKLVVENMEVLTQMRTSFDKPDHMAALFKKLTCKDTHTHTPQPDTNQLMFDFFCEVPQFTPVQLNELEC